MKKKALFKSALHKYHKHRMLLKPEAGIVINQPDEERRYIGIISVIPDHEIEEYTRPFPESDYGNDARERYNKATN